MAQILYLTPRTHPIEIESECECDKPHFSRDPPTARLFDAIITSSSFEIYPDPLYRAIREWADRDSAPVPRRLNDFLVHALTCIVDGIRINGDHESRMGFALEAISDLRIVARRTYGFRIP